MKRSTGKPTKEEAEWIVAVKEGPCLACRIFHNEFFGSYGVDAHHLLSGGRRRGHLFTIGLCAWHHRGVPNEPNSPEAMRAYFGPSLMDGSKRFHEAYGSDDALLELQRALIHG